MAALTALGAIVRFATLNAKGFWEDEGATAVLMRADLWDMVGTQIKELEAAPPLFYVLEWGAAQALGTGEVALRLLPALFGVAAIPFAYLAGKELVSERAGVAAAALVAVNPLLVWYSQEARAYSVLVLLSGGAVVLCPCAEGPEPAPSRGMGGGLRARPAHALLRGVRVRGSGGDPAPPWRAHARGLGVRRRRRSGGRGARSRSRPRRRPSSGPAGSPRRPLLDRALQLPALLLVGFESPAPIAVAALAGLLALGILVVLARRAEPDERRGAAIAAVVAVAAAGMPLILAAGGLDYFIYKNVIAAAVAGSVLLGAGSAPRGSAWGWASRCARYHSEWWPPRPGSPSTAAKTGGRWPR